MGKTVCERDATKNYLTSESVTVGHPDKMCDQVADAILDDILAHDGDALVGCEVTICRDMLHIMGEVTSSYEPDYEAIARKTLTRIGYSKRDTGFNARKCTVQVDVHGQSPDITRSVERTAQADAGAGDQGMIFGYACNESDCLMPLPITLAHQLAHQLQNARAKKPFKHLLPDGKAQISVEYDDFTPKRIAAVILSAQHEPDVNVDALREDICEKIILPTLPANMVDDATLLYVNPTGRFAVGGPAAKVGLSGRKTVVDLYGGCARSGGSSLAGKDPSKINRSGAYMARYIAKNIVAAKLAQRCEVRMAYSIGLADPVCVSVDTLGTGKGRDEQLTDWVQRTIDLRPSMIISRFNLRRPIYSALSCYGHVGQNALDMPWEQTDIASQLASEIH